MMTARKKSFELEFFHPKAPLKTRVTTYTPDMHTLIIKNPYWKIEFYDRNLTGRLQSRYVYERDAALMETPHEKRL